MFGTLIPRINRHAVPSAVVAAALLGAAVHVIVVAQGVRTEPTNIAGEWRLDNVYFRRSDVISAGDLFSTVSYPTIDVAKGGSVQGVIRGLNAILDLAVAEYRSQGGTWIVPGHGRLSDTADVASYRNMIVIIRDRVQNLMEKGMTLEQVKAARPSMDFDGRYGSTTGAWTTGMFIDAVYRSLQEKK
jgi:cyclase